MYGKEVLLLFLLCLIGVSWSARNKQWTPLTLQPQDIPQPRSQAAFANDGVKRFFLWGGVSRRHPYTNNITFEGHQIAFLVGDPSILYFHFHQNDLCIFDIDSRTWSVNVDNSSTIRPEPRYGAASVYYHADGNSGLVMFGGVSSFPYPEWQANSLYIFDENDTNWHIIDTGMGAHPGPGSGHSMIFNTNNNKVYLFGGLSPFAVLDCTNIPSTQCIGAQPLPSNNVWELELNFTAKTGQWKKLQPAGVAPQARAEHSAIFHPDENCMYICGGVVSETKGYNVTDDCWRFNFTSNVWTQLPSGFDTRAGHRAALAVSKEYMLVFAGYHYDYANDFFKYYFKNNTWEYTQGLYPAAPPRKYHALFPYGSEADPDLFLVTSGRNYKDDDTIDIGELYCGKLGKAPSGNGTVLKTPGIQVLFDRDSPSNRLLPTDPCGNVAEDKYVDIKFKNVREYSRQEALVQTLDLNLNQFDLKGSGSNATFSLNNSVNVNLTLDFGLTTNRTVIDYANTTFALNPDTLKWGFNLAGWEFKNPDNILVATIGVSSSLGPWETIRKTVDKQSKRVIYNFALGEQKSIIAISMVCLLLKEATSPVLERHDVVHSIDYSNLREVLIKIKFPSFYRLEYDPDFGVILTGGDGDGCGGESDGLESGSLAAIIVLSIIIPLCLILVAFVLVVYFWVARRRQVRVKRSSLAMVNIDSDDLSTSSTPSSAFGFTSSTESPDSDSDSYL